MLTDAVFSFPPGGGDSLSGLELVKEGIKHFVGTGCISGRPNTVRKSTSLLSHTKAWHGSYYYHPTCFWRHNGELNAARRPN